MGSRSTTRTRLKGRGIQGVPLKLAIMASFVLFVFLALTSSAFASRTVVNFLGQTASGEAGSQFRDPTGLAVNETGAGGVPAGSLYVADRNNFRVQQFGPAGEFIRAWGWGVKDSDPEFEICVAAEKCRHGIQGSEAGQFNENGMTGVAVDQSSGNVYVADQVNARINIFSAKGVFIGAFGWGVRDFSDAFQFCTTATGCISGRFFGEGKGGKFSGLIGGLAVSPAGDIYVANSSYRRVDVLRPVLSGTTVTNVEFIRAFGKNVIAGGGEGYEICTESEACEAGIATEEAGGFAEGSPTDVEVDSEGNIYALDTGNHRVQKFDSSATPVEATFGAAAISATFGSGLLQNLALDTSSAPNRVLLSGSRETSGNRLAVLKLTSAGVAAEVIGEDLPVATSRGLAAAPTVLGGNVYLSTNDPAPGGGQKVFILNEAPTIDPVTTFDGTTATFSGAVLSDEIPVNYHFEYSTDGVNWTSVPVPDAETGGAPGAVPVSRAVAKLTGSQQYFVRLVQFRALGGKATSDQVSFTTTSAAPAVTGTAASAINATSATLNAELDAQNQETTYHFEYGVEDCSTGTCTQLPDHQISSGGSVPVLQPVTGLQAGAVYHFRVVATNATGTTVGPDRTFQTTSAGTSLPAGRGYELVTPTDADGLFIGDLILAQAFDRPLVSTDGSRALWFAEGSLPGGNGNGANEAFESVRGNGGWSTTIVSPSGSQAQQPYAGGSSSDLSTTFWATGGNGGSLQEPSGETTLIRKDDGTYSLVGTGSLAADPTAVGRFIAPGASHVIFSASAVQLEPDAPPAGTGAIYDRSGGVTHVVSLLPGPGGGSTPAEGESAAYLASSEDGNAVVFEIAGTMYVRLDNAETQEVATGFPTFAGVADGGSRVFYMSGGDLFAYDTSTKAVMPVGSGAETTPVNVSDDGSHAYFSSPKELAAGATAGARNLYVWTDSSLEFVATLSQRDFEGFGNSFGLVSLSNWTVSVGPEKNAFFGRANSPTRTTPDGSVLLFQSYGVSEFPFESNGTFQIYRYDDRDGSLNCVSCNTLERPAGGSAELQDISGLTALNSPTTALSRIYNLTEDGSAAFFQTTDALVLDDTDGLQDVYEWRDGRVALISSGRSAENDYLFAMTPTGSDVLFKTTDSLVPQDTDQGAGSLYDARVNGGFADPVPLPACSGETCQGVPGLPPVFPGAGTAGLQGPGNVRTKPKKCKTNQSKKAKKAKKSCKKQKRKHRGKQKQGANRGSASGAATGRAGGTK